MIPQTKIEQAAMDYIYANYGSSDPNFNVARLTDNYTDFTAGVRFAEAEMGQPTISTDVKQSLFNYFAEQHGVQLLESDFYDIENYMKPEVQQIAQEFAEWSINHARPTLKFGLFDGWKLPSEVNKKHYTTSDLFAKFMEERGQG